MAEERDTEQSSIASVPAEFRPIFQDLQRRSRQASGQLQQQGAFPGPFIADPTQQQLQSVSQLENLAGLRAQQDIGSGAVDLAQATLRGDFLSPESSPFLQETIQAAIRPIEEQVTQQLLPQVQSQAIQAGALGDPRSNFQEERILRDFERQAGDTAAQIAFQNFSQERDRQFQAPQLLASGLQLEESPSRLLGEVGDIRRGFAQEEIDERQLAFEEAVNAVLRPLQPLRSFFSSTGLPFNQFTRTRQDPSTIDAVNQIIGGGGSFVSGGLCWVAEELFGTADRRTVFARIYVATHDNWFTELYRKYGKRWAAWLKRHAWAKPLVKPVWSWMARKGEEPYAASG